MIQPVKLSQGMEFLCMLAAGCRQKLPMQQQGVALITALFYLTILTLLVATALTTSVLQTRINQHSQQATQLFEDAESALIVAEHTISTQQTEGEGKFNKETRYQFKQLTNSDPCVLNYVIYAQSVCAVGKVQLESIWQLPTDKKGCSSSLSRGKQLLWRQLEE